MPIPNSSLAARALLLLLPFIEGCSWIYSFDYGVAPRDVPDASGDLLAMDVELPSQDLGADREFTEKLTHDLAHADKLTEDFTPMDALTDVPTEGLSDTPAEEAPEPPLDGSLHCLDGAMTGLLCCVDGSCAAASCVGGLCHPTCGRSPQPCCGHLCARGQVCVMSSSPRCVACGAAGQPCCDDLEAGTSVCNTALTCSDGTCLRE